MCPSAARDVLTADMRSPIKICGSSQQLVLTPAMKPSKLHLCVSLAVIFVCGFCASLRLNADPTDTPAYQQAMSDGMAADHSDDLANALTAYVQASVAAPRVDTPLASIGAMITSRGMPRRLTGVQLSALRRSPGPFLYHSFSDGNTVLMLDGTTGHSVDTLTDPQNGWPFAAIASIYVPDSNEPSGSTLVCTVHFQTPDDRDLAEHTARLLALLRNVLMKRTGQQPEFNNAFNVWLSRNSATVPGGEQWRNNVYLYDIADQRSSIEWIREIAHEYGHLALPPLGGEYTDPEAWANGYVGERLMVRWLADPKYAGQDAVEAAWGRTFDGYPNFKAKLIDPALAEFEHSGLSRTMLARKDGTGMRYLIGLCLWTDMTKGGPALGDLLWNATSTDPSDLYEASAKLGAPMSPKLAALTHRASQTP